MKLSGVAIPQNEAIFHLRKAERGRISPVEKLRR